MIVVVESEILDRFSRSVSYLFKELSKENDIIHELTTSNDELDRDATIQVALTNNDFKISVRELNLDITATEETFIEKINNALAIVLGYTPILLFGFKVKDKNNNKLQPKITVYAKNTHLYNFPLELEYVKTKEEPAIPSNDLNYVECYTDSDIILSLLKNDPMKFSSNGIGYYFFMYKAKACIASYEICCDAFLEDIFMAKKQNAVAEFLDKNNIKEAKIIKQLYFYGFKKNLKSVVSKIRNDVPKYQLLEDFLLEFLKVVPKFYDERDRYTEKIQDALAGCSVPRMESGDFEYLKLSRHKFPERIPIGSLKEYYNLKLKARKR